MNIEITALGDVVIIRIEGPCTRETRSIPSLNEHVKHRLGLGDRKFIFDLRNAEIQSDIGVGDILSCYSSITKAGGQLKLAIVPPRTHGLFKSIMIDKFLEIHESIESAMESWTV